MTREDEQCCRISAKANRMEGRANALQPSGYTDTKLEGKHMSQSRNEYHRRQFYRDSERGVILGVCAGIAECFDWPVWLTRVGAIALGWCFPVSVVVAYIVAALIMPERPLRYCGDGDERSYWQSHRHRS
jgi:phage shock protein C